MKCEKLPRDAPRHWKTSAELCEYVASFSDTVLLGFSAGKDSLSAWLQLRRYFKRVVPVYFYYVPGIRFIEDSLRYYEDFFGVRIHRLPDESFFNIVDGCIYQPPERVKLFDGAELHRGLTRHEVFDWLRKKYDAKYALVGDGSKMSDSLRRRLTFVTYGTLYPHKQKFYSVFDWKDDDMEREIRAAGCKLAVDYRHFKRTWEGARNEQNIALREFSPEDYETLKMWMPLLEADAARRRFYEEEGLSAHTY